MAWTTLCNKYLFDGDGLFQIVLAVTVPFILLFGILQYKNKWVYFIVVAIFGIVVFIDANSFLYYYKLSLKENPEVMCSCDPVYEIKSNIKSILLFLLSIISMFTRDMRKIYLDKSI